MKKEIVVKIDHRLLYTFIVLGILIVIAVGVYAYGTSDPTVFGHSFGELDLSGGFTVPSGDVIISSGNVGIGVTNPPHELEVNGNIGTEGLVADAIEGDSVRTLNLEADYANVLYYIRVTGALAPITIGSACTETEYAQIRRCNTGTTTRALCSCSLQSGIWQWRMI